MMRNVKTVIKAAVMALALAPFWVVPSGAAPGINVSDQENFAGWLSEAVKSYIYEELSSPDKTIESIKVNIPSHYRPPENFDSFKIMIPHRGGQSSKVFVLVSFNLNDRAFSRLNVIANVKVSRDVVVARKDIKRGDVILPDDVETVRRSTGPFTRNLMSDLSKVVGLQSDRNIRAGTALRSSHLSWPKMVRSGDIVTVIAKSGPMTITVTGEAAQDGNKGEWIKVTNTESRKIINARVTGPGEVRVEF